MNYIIWNNLAKINNKYFLLLEGILKYVKLANFKTDHKIFFQFL